MAKSIKDLKKENAFLKNKCEKSDITLRELVDEVRVTSVTFVLPYLSSIFSNNDGLLRN